MEQFTSLQYLGIAVANHYGLDRELWDVRLKWFETHKSKLMMQSHSLYTEAKEPILMRKMMNAYIDVSNGKPTGVPVFLDATASGLQLFACLTGCESTAKYTNLIDPIERYCPYAVFADKFNKNHSTDVTRKMAKDAVMPTFYGSQKEPLKVFGKKIDEYWELLVDLFPGPVEALEDILSCWTPDKVHTWTLPDGHTAYVPVLQVVDYEHQFNNPDIPSVIYSQKKIKGKDKGISIAANVIHSIDGYVVREMLRRTHAKRTQLLTIHDCFGALPKHMNTVRQLYVDILTEICEMDLLQSILRDITKDDSLKYTPYGDRNVIIQGLKSAEYPLS